MPYGGSEVSNDVRISLARLARVRGTRTQRFSADVPTHWAPGEVTSPETGVPFTIDGSWEFVADALESGAPIECIILEKPPGRKAYVLLLDGTSGAKIYVKLQLGSGVVIGRSFHLSNRT